MSVNCMCSASCGKRAAPRRLGGIVDALATSCVPRHADSGPPSHRCHARPPCARPSGSFRTAHRVQINTLAVSAELPTVHGGREFVEAGGLMSYGPNFADL